MNRWITALLMTCFCVRALPAQTLADHVPADAIGYAEWKGADTLGPQYDQSQLKKMMDATDWPAQFGPFWQRALNKIGQSDRDARNVINIVQPIAATLWRHPTGFYVGPVDMTDRRHPRPRVALLCEAGEDAVLLRRRVNNILAGQQTFVERNQVKVAGTGTLVIIEMGDIDLDKISADQSLASDAVYKAALTQGQKESAFCAFVSGTKLNGMITSMGSARPGEQPVNPLEVLGFGNLKSLVCTTGFAGAKWGSELHMSFDGAAPQVKPLSKELLQSIPVSATSAIAGRLDLGVAFDQFFKFIHMGSPRAEQDLAAIPADFKRQTGLDLHTDVFAPLGDEWALYADPQIGGSSVLGLVLVNHLRDPARFEQSLKSLEGQLNEILGQALGRQGMSLGFRTIEKEGAAIHYFSSPLISPTWAIVDGNLYVSLYPQTAIGAVHQAKSGKSILENPSYVALMKELGDHAPSGMAFYDLPRTVGDQYAGLLLVSRLGLGMADMFGLEAPAIGVPTLHDLQPLMSPAGNVSWTDEAGWHSRGVSPFPGAEAFSGMGMLQSQGPATSALMTSILLPSLSRSREFANRVKCGNNLRSIGQAVVLYQGAKNGKMPKSLGAAMIETDAITLDTLVCPSSNNDAPAGELTDEQKIDWANQHASYILLDISKLKMDDLRADRVMAFEKPDNHDGDGINILYCDGHVDWVTLNEAKTQIEASGGKLELPAP